MRHHVAILLPCLFILACDASAEDVSLRDGTSGRGDAPAEMRESVLAGDEAAWAGQGAQQLHESWCAERQANGWVHGSVKDRDAKTHPCLVEYHELPMAQRMKDVVFGAIASAGMFADA